MEYDVYLWKRPGYRHWDIHAEVEASGSHVAALEVMGRMGLCEADCIVVYGDGGCVEEWADVALSEMPDSWQACVNSLESSR